MANSNKFLIRIKLIKDIIDFILVANVLHLAGNFIQRTKN